MPWFAKAIRRAFFVVIAWAPIICAGDDSQPVSTEPMVVPTWGGKQFWGDVLFFHGWRIQQNILTGSYRLLDELDHRHAQGTYRQCLAALEEIKRQGQLPPMTGRGVLLLHGLGRSRGSMRRLADTLRREGGLSVFNVSYPSTRGSIREHARRLAHVIEHLVGLDELHFVGHSMGNIVVRHYLADLAARGDPAGSHPPLGRMVMLGPPNQGSELAGKLGRYRTFGWALGRGAMELGPNFPDLARHLATPPIEFGIIAGGRKREGGYNPLVDGDNDWVVSVETTKLPGARDFVVLPVLHTFMMDDATVQEYTLRFLLHGHFVAEDRRNPIPLVPSPPAAGWEATATTRAGADAPPEGSE